MAVEVPAPLEGELAEVLGELVPADPAATFRLGPEVVREERRAVRKTWVQISEELKMKVENTSKIPKYSIFAFQNTELLEARSRLCRSQILQVNTT